MAMFKAAVLQSSIVEVVKVAEAELHDLSTLRHAIKQRIRSIQCVLHGLQQGVGDAAVDKSSTELPLHARPLHTRPHETARVSDYGVAPGRTGPYGELDTGGKADDADARLRRACRVALMETEGAASVTEICSRILRRGSFPLSDHEQAVIAVVRILDAMAGDGETRCIEGGQCRCWERIAREEVL